jgi:excinuclease ABC subunit B
VLTHNKTLVAQLYGEFKQFFPDNAVEYFVSYYDYYQPEAFIPVTGTYIEKDLSINEELEKLRLSTTSALLSGRRDIIVVSSVSCLYGIGNPVEFQKNVVSIAKGEIISRTKLLHRLVQSLYSRTEAEFLPGTFRIKGDTVDIFPSYADEPYRVHFFGDEIEEIEAFDAKSSKVLERYEKLNIYPANMFVTSPDVLQAAIWDIQQDLVKQVDYFKEIGKHLEAKRLEERTNFDLEMIRELGYCSGIENYSRYLDRRLPGTRPFCLLDYFPDDYLMVVDESHVTISQVHAMYGGDRSRKMNLVDYGFRLPAALDNRPLQFEEFYGMINQAIYVSATPADFELKESTPLDVHRLLTKGIPFFEDCNMSGQYRTTSVWIGIDMCPKFVLLPSLMMQWYECTKKWMDSCQDKKSAYNIAWASHNMFEVVHPFIDGNGRTGRLLFNKVLVELGCDPVIFQFDDRYEYYECIQEFRNSYWNGMQFDFTSLKL